MKYHKIKKPANIIYTGLNYKKYKVSSQLEFSDESPGQLTLQFIFII